MANSEVLLLHPIEGLGAEGDRVSVKSGYARNFLFPKKMAIPLNQGNKKQIEALQKAKEERILIEKEKAKSLAERISDINLKVFVKTGDNGRMFGSVTALEILNLLSEKNIKLDKKQLKIAQPIKEIGIYNIEVKLNPEIKVNLNLEIASEADEQVDELPNASEELNKS